ncbi:hypothetical protein DUI87_05931 [Hirundo rustica rustica]|uniref:Uncharacterized protein n=1 Tax=Hirundo rustica rustica TaxID=333673 RepID=A0A3M0L342_HIRRU|nr:hypothetical protein DUI87_05931 [Hirundo rustica rustica]
MHISNFSQRENQEWERNLEVSGEGGGGGAPGARTPELLEIALQPVVQPMVRQLCPCSPWRATPGQMSSWSPWRTPHWSKWMPKGGCNSMGSLHSTCVPVKRGAHAGAGLFTEQTCDPMTLELPVHEGLSTMRGVHCGSGEECEKSFP